MSVLRWSVIVICLASWSAATAARTSTATAAGTSAAATGTTAIMTTIGLLAALAIAIEVLFGAGLVGALVSAFEGHAAGPAPQRHLPERASPPPILARCSFRMALRDSLMRLPSTASTFTST